MNPAILVLAAYGLAIVSILRNSKSDRRMRRGSFILVFAIVSFPYWIVTVSDLSMVLNEQKFLESDSLLDFIYVYNVIVAYPFFQRICWRVNDAGSHRAVPYACLIPYLNILIFFYLCFEPTRGKKQP